MQHFDEKKIHALQYGWLLNLCIVIKYAKEGCVSVYLFVCY